MHEYFVLVYVFICAFSRSISFCCTCSHSKGIGVGWLVVSIRCYIVLLGSHRIAAWKRYICFYCRSTGCVRKVHKHISFVHLPQSTEIRVIFSSPLNAFFSFATEHRVEKFSSLLPFDISSTFFFDFFCEGKRRMLSCKMAQVYSLPALFFLYLPIKCIELLFVEQEECFRSFSLCVCLTSNEESLQKSLCIFHSHLWRRTKKNATSLTPENQKCKKAQR